MTTPNLAVATPVSRRTEPIPTASEAQILAQGMTRLKQMLLDLLADSLRLQTGQGQIARLIAHSYLALVVNWVKLRPLLRYDIGNRREIWEASITLSERLPATFERTDRCGGGNPTAGCPFKYGAQAPKIAHLLPEQGWKNVMASSFSHLYGVDSYISC